jgi:hypothetical protein
MLLVNFVLVMLWQRDAMQHEIEKNRIILAGIQALLPVNCSTLENSLPVGLLSVRWVSNPSSGHIQLYYNK